MFLLIYVAVNIKTVSL